MKHNCKVIAVANQKGGVGKTTTTANLGIGITKMNKKVLLIDFDPQADLTAFLGWKNSDGLEQTISQVLDAQIDDKNIDYSNIILSHNEGVDLLPSNIELANFEMKLVGVLSREKILDSSIKPLREKYDYILIDCPPSLGMLTINALSSANEVLIPVQAQYLPAKGMTQLLKTISKLKSQINPNLNVSGITITLANMQTNLAKSTVETLKNNFGLHLNVFNSIIPVSTKAAESAVVGQSIYEYATNSNAANAYESLTKELVNSHKIKTKDNQSR